VTQRHLATRAHTSLPRTDSSTQWRACAKGGLLPPSPRREQAALQQQLAALDARHEARLADMAALSAGSGRVAQLTQHYDRVLAGLADERDALQAERAALLQASCGHWP